MKKLTSATEKTEKEVSGKKVSEKKKKILSELIELVEKSNTTMICSIINIPSSQLQKLRKKLKEAKIRVVKKKIAIMAFEKAKKEKVSELKNNIPESFAILLSELEPYELASILSDNRTKARAKAGQIAPEDIGVEAGPTDLPPGPIISELSAAGIKAGMQGGKIMIKESKVLVKKGDKISKQMADILSKLEIMPFIVGIEPATAYDSKTKIIYKEIRIDKEGTLNSLKECAQKALGFALKIVYPAKETITQLLAKATRNFNAVQSKLNVSENTGEKASDNADKTENKKTEEK